MSDPQNQASTSRACLPAPPPPLLPSPLLYYLPLFHQNQHNFPTTHPAQMNPNFVNISTTAAGPGRTYSINWMTTPRTMPTTSPETNPFQNPMRNTISNSEFRSVFATLQQNQPSQSSESALMSIRPTLPVLYETSSDLFSDYLKTFRPPSLPQQKPTGKIIKRPMSSNQLTRDPQQKLAFTPVSILKRRRSAVEPEVVPSSEDDDVHVINPIDSSLYVIVAEPKEKKSRTGNSARKERRVAFRDEFNSITEYSPEESPSMTAFSIDVSRTTSTRTTVNASNSSNSTGAALRNPETPSQKLSAIPLHSVKASAPPNPPSNSPPAIPLPSNSSVSTSAPPNPPVEYPPDRSNAPNLSSSNNGPLNNDNESLVSLMQSPDAPISEGSPAEMTISDGPKTEEETKKFQMVEKKYGSEKAALVDLHWRRFWKEKESSFVKELSSAKSDRDTLKQAYDIALAEMHKFEAAAKNNDANRIKAENEITALKAARPEVQHYQNLVQERTDDITKLVEEKTELEKSYQTKVEECKRAITENHRLEIELETKMGTCRQLLSEKLQLKIELEEAQKQPSASSVTSPVANQNSDCSALENEQTEQRTRELEHSLQEKVQKLEDELALSRKEYQEHLSRKSEEVELWKEHANSSKEKLEELQNKFSRCKTKSATSEKAELENRGTNTMHMTVNDQGVQVNPETNIRETVSAGIQTNVSSVTSGTQTNVFMATSETQTNSAVLVDAHTQARFRRKVTKKIACSSGLRQRPQKNQETLQGILTTRQAQVQSTRVGFRAGTTKANSETQTPYQSPYHTRLKIARSIAIRKDSGTEVIELSDSEDDNPKSAEQTENSRSNAFEKADSSLEIPELQIPSDDCKLGIGSDTGKSTQSPAGIVTNRKTLCVSQSPIENQLSQRKSSTETAQVQESESYPTLVSRSLKRRSRVPKVANNSIDGETEQTPNDDNDI